MRRGTPNSGEVRVRQMVGRSAEHFTALALCALYISSRHTDFFPIFTLPSHSGEADHPRAFSWHRPTYGFELLTV